MEQIVSLSRGTESNVVVVPDRAYVKDGVLYRYSYFTSTVMVESSSDLEELAELVDAGTIAHTVGYTSKWQLGTNGEWVAISGSEPQPSTEAVVGSAVVGTSTAV